MLWCLLLDSCYILSSIELIIVREQGATQKSLLDLEINSIPISFYVGLKILTYPEVMLNLNGLVELFVLTPIWFSVAELVPCKLFGN